MTATTLSHAQPLMIAHASGGLNGQDYTNSLESLEANYNKGFRVFEIDFSWTSDGQLVCLHDWDKRFKKVFGYSIKKPLSYHEFQMALYHTDGTHPCTPETLANWVLDFPDVQIVTDVKHNNLKAIKLIVKNHPKIQKQLIVQFYQPEEYSVLKKLGFKNLIWILYQYQGSLKSVATLAQNMDLFALSMRASQAKKKPMQSLREKGINLFVYTLNTKSTLKKMTNKYGVSGIYTDFLPANVSTHN